MDRISISLIVFLLCTPFVFGETMSSANFKILQDSLNDASQISSSTNFRANDTLGEQGNGSMVSSNYRAFGGFLYFNESYISISLPTNASMTPAIASGASTVASGTTAVTIITDNPAGYKLEINASTTPALKSGSIGITDYTEAITGTAEAWSFASGARFGFSAIGDDVVANFKNSGSTCGSGIANGLCFLGLQGATKILVSRIYTRTPVLGTTTTIKYKAENKGATLTSSDYTGTITLTATPN